MNLQSKSMKFKLSLYFSVLILLLIIAFISSVLPLQNYAVFINAFLLVGSAVIAMLCWKLIWSFTNTCLELSTSISNSAKEILFSSTQTSAESKKISTSISDTITSLSDTSTTINALRDSSNKNANTFTEAHGLAEHASEIAEAGATQVTTLVAAIGDIAKSNKKIEEISSVIDGIAFQTNLLALNAAVEAARAGEQGKGFAVVANAVRTLAQQSSTSAKEIASLIDETVDTTGKGVITAASSGTTLKAVVDSVGKVKSLIETIAEASRSQANAIAEVGKMMQQIDSTNKNTSTSADAFTSTSTELGLQTQHLQQQVEQLICLLVGQSGDKNYAVKQRVRPEKAAPQASKITPTATVSQAVAPSYAPKSANNKTDIPKVDLESIIPFESDFDEEPQASSTRLGTLKDF